MLRDHEKEHRCEWLARRPVAARFLHACLVASVLVTALLSGAKAANTTHAARVLGDNAEPNAQIGTASWYGNREAGRRTASGAIFDPSQLTGAHRTFPLGTCVRVTHLGNGRFVIVPITDRGPYIRGRLIDLSEAAAQVLGIVRTGLAQVRIEIVAACLKEMKAGSGVPG